MVAFEAAIQLGYRYVETDVHATADGVLLAFHDDELDRLTDRRGLVAAMPWEEVSRARVAGREPIATFDELLAHWPDLRINVEPKHDAAVEPLIEAIRRHAAVDRVCIGSFSGRRIARARAALGPRLCTSMGPRDVLALRCGSWGIPGFLAYARRSRAACVQLPVRARGIPLVDAASVAAAHALGLPFHVWTVNEEAEIMRLLDLGVDGIMSDRPTVLRRILEERGQWADAETGAAGPGSIERMSEPLP